MKDSIQVTSLSLKSSSPWNEDALIRNDVARIYGVIDGATSLVPFTSKDSEMGGTLAARVLLKYLYDAELSSSSSSQDSYSSSLKLMLIFAWRWRITVSFLNEKRSFGLPVRYWFVSMSFGQTQWGYAVLNGDPVFSNYNRKWKNQ